MAKTKTLSKKQLKELAGILVGTNKNIYHETITRFGINVDEKIFDRLMKECKIFHCELCSIWKDTSVMGELGEICTECLENE